MISRFRRKNTDKIIEENLQGLLRFAFFRLRSMQMAEDAVNEAVVRSLDNINHISERNFKAYLYKTLHHICIDTLRSGNLTLPLESVGEYGCQEEEPLLEEAERIDNLLDKLPQRMSEVIKMKVVDGLSFVEISLLSDTPVSTVKSRFKSGMDKLRELIKTLSDG
ncbi:MAG: RNA polymerase sigma factor [Muribaculaceae bacterium]|nr:RNA polymerase sigma factor [Muribaculaceae bacterium]